MATVMICDQPGCSRSSAVDISAWLDGEYAVEADEKGWLSVDNNGWCPDGVYPAPMRIDCCPDHASLLMNNIARRDLLLSR